jgi:predicted PurR-regulated permease PerM
MSKRINRTFAVIVIYAIVILSLSTLFYVFAPIIADEFSGFVSSISTYFPKSNVLNQLETGTISQAQHLVSGISKNLTLSGLIESAKYVVTGTSSSFIDSLSVAFGGIVNLFLIIIVSFYLSVQEKGIENFLRIIIPAKYEDYAVDLWNRSQRKIALWVRGQLLLGLLIGILIFLGLSILGVRYAILLGLSAAIFELVPFGIVLAAIPAITFAFLDGGLTLSLMTAGFYIIVQQFESYLIQPLVVNKVVGVSPLVVILSVMIGLQLAGFWGLILAIPVSVCLLEFMSDLEKKKISARSNA